MFNIHHKKVNDHGVKFVEHVNHLEATAKRIQSARARVKPKRMTKAACKSRFVPPTKQPDLQKKFPKCPKPTKPLQTRVNLQHDRTRHRFRKAVEDHYYESYVHLSDPREVFFFFSSIPFI